MYIYLDDSGNIDGKQGDLYVWAGIGFKSGYRRVNEELDRIFREFSITKGYKEKKGFDANFDERRRVFECLLSFETLRICYLIVDKNLVTENQKTFVKGALARGKEQSENYFLSKVIKGMSQPYEDATRNKIILTIDGKPQRGEDSMIRLHEYLALEINYPEWNTSYSWNHFEIKYESQDNHRLLQAADFMASFLLDYYKTVYYDPSPSSTQFRPLTALYQMLRPKVCHRIYRMPNLSLL